MSISDTTISDVKSKFKVSGQELRVSDKALSYKGLLNDQPIFLKILTSNDPKWVDRFLAEAKIQLALKEIENTRVSKITPLLIEANISHEPYYLVMDWVENAQNYSQMRWAEGEVAENIASGMGEVLYNFHLLMSSASIKVDLKKVTSEELLQKVEEYLKELPDGLLSTDNKRKIADIFPQLVKEFSNATTQIIHGDPLFTNFMSSGDHLYLIDWEYAAISHPAHDLASFWVTSSLAPKSRSITLKRYQQLYSKWDQTFEAIFALFKLRYSLRELSLLSQNRGYHTTFTPEEKQQIIQDQLQTISDTLITY